MVHVPSLFAALVLRRFVLLEVVRGDQISTVFGDAADLYGDLAAQAMVSKINTDARLLEQTTLISFSSNTTDTSRDVRSLVLVWFALKHGTRNSNQLKSHSHCHARF